MKAIFKVKSIRETVKKASGKHSFIKSTVRCFIVFLLILIQFAFVFLCAYYLANRAVYVYLMIELLSVLILLPLVEQERNAAYKIYWIGVILVLPLVGHIMYELWGREKVNRRLHRRIQKSIDEANSHSIVSDRINQELSDQDAQTAKISFYLSKCGYPCYDNTQIEYYESGERVFKSMMKDFAGAQRFIALSFFTIADGRIWSEINTILDKKVKCGVRVQVMYDDAGSVMQLSDSAVEKMQKSGIEVLRFNPVEKHYHGLFFNYRNHQKIAVIDGSIAYTGGVNISDRYANIGSPYGHWKDIAVRLKGDAVRTMSLIFLGMWEASGKKENYEEYLPTGTFSNGYLCQPFADGPSNNPMNVAMDMFIHTIQTAVKEVNIMTPYLIIDDTMRDTICLAAKSGVKITIITPGIPDKKYTKKITEWHYGSLLKAGVHILEYLPGFVHAKLCFNEKSAVIGTINMDFRSFFTHFENGVWIPEGPVLDKIRKDFIQTAELSREITYEEWKNRPLSDKVMQAIAVWVKCQF